MEFRIKFLREELDEIVKAARSDDMPGLLDGIVDLVYVALGMAHVYGFPFHEAWAEVQRANMAKERCLRAEDSTRGSTYDVIKPPGWRAPDIARVLRPHGWPV